MSVTRKLGIVLLYFFAGSGLMAQNNTNSPYSRFGIGDLESQAFVRNLGMGGISLGIRDPRYIGFQNPASFSARDSMSYVFEFSLQAKRTYLKTTDQSASGGDINLRHVVMAFPITKWWGTSIGILPYSTLGYQMLVKDSIPGISKVSYDYLGEGGLSRFFFGNGFRLKNFSVGVNFTYLFGGLERTTTLKYLSDPDFSQTQIYSNTYVRDIVMSLGAQYTLELIKNVEFILGGFYESPTKLRTRVSSRVVTLLDLGESGVVIDTISNVVGQLVDMRYPRNYGLGFSVRVGEKLLTGAEYHNQQWSSSYFPGVTDSLVNQQSFHAGVEYTPNHLSIKSYLATVHYRMGVRYTNTYLQLRDKQINDIALTMGLGFPLGRSYTTFNLAFQYGFRGTTSHQLIRERYALITFGITLYDYWFIKAKFD
jgi:hypothetical protein